MLKQTQVNKNIIFQLSITDEKLIRTGTIPDGSCAYHSVLHAFSKDYIKLDIENRKKFVKKIRSNIAKSTTKEKWLQIDNGVLSNILFQQKLNFLLNKLKSILNEEQDEKFIDLDVNKDKKVYQILFEILSFDYFEQNIIPKSIVENSLSETITQILKNSDNELKTNNSVKQINEKKVEYLRSKLDFLLKYILEKAEKIAFEEYVSEIKNPDKYTNIYSINLICDWFNRNILFINGDTNLPYKYASNYNPERKTIILLWINKSHYEVVGKIVEKNRAKREFSDDDELIQKIKTHLEI